MSKKMRIEGMDYPKKTTRKAKGKITRPSLFHPRQFIWAGMIGALWFGALVYGTPHLRFIYTYSGTGENRYYHKCDYVGWNSQRYMPVDGRCPIIRFFPLGSGGADQ